MDTVKKIMDIENRIYDAYGVTSRPDLNTWERMIKDIAQEIIKTPGLLESITPADLDALTDHNYHTARRGAEYAIALSLKAE